MKKTLYLIIFLIHVLPIYAQNVKTENEEVFIKCDTLIMNNEVDIVNEELKSILENRIYPHLLFWDECIEISMEYNKELGSDIMYIIIRFQEYISLEEWKHYDGYYWNEKEKVMVLFKDCKSKNIIKMKHDNVARIITVSNFQATQDWRVWVYEFRNDRLKFIEQY